MIKFFRRVRQRLLSENKFSKYLLYAIGEIILVVIGILIALQINNWNEARKTSLKADVYVKNIMYDLKTDTLNINKLLTRVESFSNSIDRYFEYFNSNKAAEVSIESLLDSINTTNAYYFKYDPMNKAFKDMDAYGNSNLLNESQREILIKIVTKQEEFELIFDNVMDKCLSESSLSSHYLGEPSNFYKRLQIENTTERKTQGLLHSHIFLQNLNELYRYFESYGKSIKQLSREAIEVLNRAKDD
jgi:hypothetical protein